MELLENDVPCLSLTSESVVKGDDGRQPVHGRPVGLTITAEKIDRVLADVQAQVERLQCQAIILRFVRDKFAGMEAKWRSA